jgi:hypothetical protein
MADYMGAGKGTTALAILGTVLGSLGVAGNGGFGLFNNNAMCHENTPVNRYELGQEQKIAELQSQVALRDANTYSDQKLLEVYKYFDGELKDIRAHMCENEKLQAVINAKFESGFAVLNTQVACISNTINSLTKTVIPNSSICPGFGEVTVTPVTPTATVI